MLPEQLLSKLEEITAETGAAVLCTTDSRGKGFLRWMTPFVLNYRPGIIYAFTAPNSAKIAHIEEGSDAEWMFQKRDLSEVINIRGAVKVVSSPSLKAELLDIFGDKLFMFWKSNTSSEEFVILETTIEQASYLLPMEGTRESVWFT